MTRFLQKEQKIDKAKLAELLPGRTYKEVGAILGCTRQYAHHLAKELGITNGRVRKEKPGKPFSRASFASKMRKHLISVGLIDCPSCRQVKCTKNDFSRGNRRCKPCDAEYKRNLYRKRERDIADANIVHGN